MNNDKKLSAGSIAGSGFFDLGGNQLTVGGNNQSTMVTGVVADGGGAGGLNASLVKTGTGTLTLSGANTYAGPTSVTAGTLAVTGSLVSDVTVTGSIFGGSGSTSKTLTVQSGGTVAPGVLTPGTTFTTLNVTGNATFASGSTFVVNVNGQGQNDKLAVGGTATLNGGTVNVNALSGRASRPRRPSRSSPRRAASPAASRTLRRRTTSPSSRPMRRRTETTSS